MTLLLNLGDVHMGAHPQYADDRAGEQEAVLSDCAALAIEHQVDAVLLAGDLFHGPTVKSSLYRRVQRSFVQPLRDAGIPVVAVSGNGAHDSAANEGEDNALTVLHQPGFDVYTRPALHALAGCTVATLPWTPITRKVAAQNGGDRDDVNAEAALQLVAVARDLYEKAPSDRPCVLLGHWTLSGWSTPTGMDTSLLRDVVLPSDELAEIGFDACVFGHIHKGGIVVGDIDPVFYVGSPMPLDFGEATCDHGCWLLTVGDDEPEALEFLPIESRPFKTLHFDFVDEPLLVDFVMMSDFGADCADPTTDAIVKVRYTATREQARRIDNAAIRQALLDAGAHRVYVETTIQREQRSRVAGLDENVSDSDALDLWIRAQDIDEARAATLRAQHTTYTEALA